MSPVTTHNIMGQVYSFAVNELNKHEDKGRGCGAVRMMVIMMIILGMKQEDVFSLPPHTGHIDGEEQAKLNKKKKKLDKYV